MMRMRMRMGVKRKRKLRGELKRAEKDEKRVIW
jgi:hypothetical protein